ncbi:outer membrane beta-barrel protein [Ichthyobacterium seriolicida]|uniref:Outer membrane protein beta-barrel domain-containing protein n=1 Tax=Ichthyobacterium seriolicida TaxID=242600 RepID=A0A1J1DXE3_9FLAO|nr:outer membrane beta-barrel protein [Ichthyobacterium seriolicida]BAV94497.1 hypothetical protein JBKA6_0484 [Ichthyobacterium seriolicida]
MSVKNTLILFAVLFISLGEAKAQDQDQGQGYYLEDLLFFSFRYNTLLGNPQSIHQKWTSLGYSTGYIRDIPFTFISEKRNIGIGIGISITYNNYSSNFKLSMDDKENTQIRIIDSDEYNSFSLFYVDLPLELRFRTSALGKADYFRFYPGIKASLLLHNDSMTVNGKISHEYNNHYLIFTNVLFGPTLSMGYGIWNLNVYYSINSIFRKDISSDIFNGENLDLKTLNVGLTFYIL